MSRGCGFAWSEVEFDGVGGRYVARWEQSRARRRPGAALQNVKISLLDAVSGEDLGGHRTADTLEAVAEKAGAGMKRFLRSSMLAQGMFDRFLSAKENERAELLEEATGTGIYAATGMEIFRRRREAEGEVASLADSIAAAPVLSAEERAAMEKELEEAKAAAEDARKRLAAVDAGLGELRRLREEAAAAKRVLASRRARRAKCEEAAAGLDAALAESSAALQKALSAAAAGAAERENARLAARPALKAAVDATREALDFAISAEALESRRRRLKPGEPCPLCGATDHPYAAGAAVPVRGRLQIAHDAALAALENFDAAQRDAEARLRNAVDAAKTAHADATSRAATAKAWNESAAAELAAAESAAADADAACAAALAALAARFPPDAPDADVERTLAASSARLSAAFGAANRAAGALDARLKLDSANRSQRASREAKLVQARETAARWTVLDGMLGGSGGEKFRRYAQGVTLRRLLAAANPHLFDMTAGRYSLVWDVASADASKLLPSVVDADRAGEVRPVTNLSGGERFQVSLALALALSDVSGAKGEVGNLFLDEGFGSLDAKALDCALDALCRLRLDGRLVGIISHVAAIGERIPARIEVVKIGAGRSVLRLPYGEEKSRLGGIRGGAAQPA